LAGKNASAGEAFGCGYPEGGKANMKTGKTVYRSVSKVLDGVLQPDGASTHREGLTDYAEIRGILKCATGVPSPPISISDDLMKGW
jgi:hypothetical protein